MRVLVEQTYDNACRWIENLIASNSFPSSRTPQVYMLKGGEIQEDWERYPEQDAIIIGTQDQLLSRALNRGYSMSRYRWPIHFGLLNNDCLWVMDEVQLMGIGLATTTQMQAFRESFGTVHTVRSVWMSATLKKDWLGTVDFVPCLDTVHNLILSEEDLKNPSVKKRFYAVKRIEKAPFPASSIKDIVQLTLSEHKAGTKTLVVVNTVNRASQIYKTLLKQIKTNGIDIDLTLVHSRFRPDDRKAALQKLLDPPGPKGTVCVSTQVVEAGVDVSATTLITDLAPWASLVQRFGRCNREGLEKDARVYWLEIDLSKKNASAPYAEYELHESAVILKEFSDVGPKNLPPVKSKPEHTHVIRRKDILELFDTTPDLSGMDVDVSRFIREADDHDVHVFWRDIPKGERPDEHAPAPVYEELCSVPIQDIRKIKSTDMWCWDYLEKRWINQQPNSVHPGMTLMLRSADGGYSRKWVGPATQKISRKSCNKRLERKKPMMTTVFLQLAGKRFRIMMTLS